MSKSTIIDVAKLAGVSIKTVSRVVNKEPNVREETRTKVQTAITHLEYRPSPSARSLASKRSFLIGLLYDNPSANYVINVQKGVLASCRAHGYDVLIHPCDYLSPNLAEDVTTLIRKSRVDGIILTPPLSDMSEILDTLNNLSVPFARIAPSDHKDKAPYVYCTDRKAAFQMTEHLISLGHTKIGFITGHPDHSASAERRLGFEDALYKHKIKLPDSFIQQGYFDHQSGMSCGYSILKGAERPTAIFASNDDMAAGVMHTANRMGISIPDELSVAGFDDSPVSTQLWPPLTTIKQPVENMTELACNLLIESLKNTPQMTNNRLFDCELILRNSTKALSK